MGSKKLAANQTSWRDSPMIPAAPAELACLRCQRCGGAFELVEPARAAVCPYCRSTERVPDALLARLASYDARARAALAETSASAALADRMEKVDRSGQVVLWFYFVMVAVIAGSMLVGVALYWNREPGQPAPSVPLLALQLVGYALVIAALAPVLWMNARSAPRGMASGRFPARCPNCGGTEQLLIGQVHHTCVYCRTNLVPSGAVMAAGLSVASAELRNAELESLRASRRMFAGIGARKRSLQLFSKAWCILLPLGASVVFAHQASRGEVEPAAAAFWSAVAAVVAVYIFVQSARRRGRFQRWRRTLEALAERDPGAAFTTEFRDITSWLNAYFPEPYGKDYDLRNTGSPDLQAVSLTVSGFPVLVVVHAAPASRERFIDCLVAAVPRGARVSIDHTDLAREAGHAVIERALQTALAQLMAAGARPAPRL